MRRTLVIFSWMKPARTSREKAQRLVHRYAVFGTAWAVLPIPGATSTGLAALEAHMIYWISRYYGETPSHADVLMTMSGLELASVALKTVALEGANLVPVVGWGVKGVIAGGVVEAIGAAIIHHFEEKYPGRLLDGVPAAAAIVPAAPTDSAGSVVAVAPVVSAASAACGESNGGEGESKGASKVAALLPLLKAFAGGPR